MHSASQKYCQSAIMQNANTFDLHYAIIGLESLFWSSFEWPIKTGLLYFIAIHTRFFNKCSILETACKCSVLTETNCHFKRTTEFHEPPLDRPLTLLEVMQFREIAGIPVWQQSWVQIDKKTETKNSTIFIGIVFPCVLCAQENRLLETVLLNTHNTCIGR